MADLKDLFTDSLIQSIADRTSQYDPTFNQEVFFACTYTDDWEQLALKQRVRRLSTALHEGINKPYTEALPVIKKTAAHFSGLTGIVFPDFVEQYGLDHWPESVVALAELTAYSTSEFAVRPFLLKDTGRMLAQMKEWTRSDSDHIRRLASEGARPRLPWGQSIPAFKKDPSPLLPLLEPLLADPSLYVRKSVANHLNDISKTHPDYVIQWVQDRHGQHAHTDWILRHASRTLLKQGNTEVLQLFGYPDAGEAVVQTFSLETDSICVGESLVFSADLCSPVDLKVRVEYAIDYMKKSGRPSRKVFHLADTHLTGGEAKTFRRSQSFRNMTTRTHYEGEHAVSILINGMEKARRFFHLNGTMKEKEIRGET